MKERKNYYSKLSLTGLAVALTISLTACGSKDVAKTSDNAQASSTASSTPSSTPSSTATPDAKIIQVVAAENEYADVVSQIGGQYVNVTGIMNDPSTDPHTYEASTTDAGLVGKATLLVQNGLGYDEFINKLASASPNPDRTVIEVATALGFGKDTQNPHLWYKPDTMPRVAKLIADELSKQNPTQSQYFQDNLQKFNQSLNTLTQALADVKNTFPKAPVAVTEPVSDYLLEAAGMDIKTPWSFQAAIMNVTDPSPQDVQLQKNLFKNHQIKVFIYNQQAVTEITKTLLALAKDNNIPVIGVYETMPANHTFQTWMEAEVQALKDALQNGKSTVTIS
jgi:zinc/manganese transport system substrate-binding protein